MRPYDEIRFKGTDEEVRAQWLEARRKGIGGSDAAAILGLSSYATPLSVWMEKTGRATPHDISDKEPVYWGNILEDVVASEFAKRHPGWKVRRLNAMLVSKEHPFMFASVDRIVTDDKGRRGILECKTAGERRSGDWSDGVPMYYLPQPTHYLAVSGLEFHAVAVLIGGQHYEDFIAERDQEDIDELITREFDFWHNHVEKDIMPDPTGAKADSASLLQAHAEPGDEFVQALDSDIPELAELVGLKAARDEVDSRIKEIQNALRKRIGDSKGIETQRFRVTWPRSQKERFDSKALKESDPATYAQYMTTSAYDGGIRIKEIK